MNKVIIIIAGILILGSIVAYFVTYSSDKKLTSATTDGQTTKDLGTDIKAKAWEPETVPLPTQKHGKTKSICKDSKSHDDHANENHTHGGHTHEGHTHNNKSQEKNTHKEHKHGKKCDHGH
jgi:hypothetical protein